MNLQTWNEFIQKLHSLTGGTTEVFMRQHIGPGGTSDGLIIGVQWARDGEIRAYQEVISTAEIAHVISPRVVDIIFKNITAAVRRDMEKTNEAIAA